MSIKIKKKDDKNVFGADNVVQLGTFHNIRQKNYLESPKYNSIKKRVDDIVHHSLGELNTALSIKEQEDLTEGILRQILMASRPKEAPQRYRTRPEDKNGKRLTLPDFVAEVWFDPWIKGGVFDRPYFRSVDEHGEMALRNYLRAAADSKQPAWPDHLKIPTRSEVLDDELADGERQRNAWRISSAQHRRNQQKNDR